MIFVKRGKVPPNLKKVRDDELALLRAIALQRAIVSKDIKKEKYQAYSKKLFDAQHTKCCYCELIETNGFNDVEHFRPKGRADRSPGSTENHGYWWLAYTWENLLFACATCNRSNKNDQFPLADAHTLQAEEQPPGEEKPLLLDPASTSINPVAHIVHVLRGSNWHAEPRNNSLLGLKTIEVCDLDRSELVELRSNHVKLNVKGHVDAIERLMQLNEPANLLYEFERALGLLEPQHAHMALNYDALRHFISDAQLQTALNRTWPQPHEVGIPPP